MILGLPAVALLFGLVPGWICLAAGRGRIAALLALALIGGILWAFARQEAAPGLDGLDRLILWLFGLAPALLGLGIGALIGHLTRPARAGAT
ncbi:hypothetical protein [Maliponia aquimaris]|uniref:Uncharacterized protein n=1 Tax=Maliponia aquimaris TaxID=1673631 RepID=A0A238KL81_9RHOB|nr:hypothetical protein [Maliponia aquimaris]SMX43460.1 hypothetical protein MAA8898_02831 [Maliponia aquimaris]